MPPAKVEWYSCHMGHDVNVHKKNYRMHTSAIEITKVGPILNMIDAGVAGRSKKGLSFFESFEIARATYLI